MIAPTNSINKEAKSQLEPTELLENEKIESRNQVARDISPIALALLLLEVKLDNVEDGFIARAEKRELQNRVKECNANVVSNLRWESGLNTVAPLAVFILSGGVASQWGPFKIAGLDPASAASLASSASQIAMPFVTGADQLFFMTDKEKNDREKQMTEQDLQTTHAQAQSARESFNQDLKRSMEAILNS